MKVVPSLTASSGSPHTLLYLSPGQSIPLKSLPHEQPENEIAHWLAIILFKNSTKSSRACMLSYAMPNKWHKNIWTNHYKSHKKVTDKFRADTEREQIPNGISPTKKKSILLP